MRADLDHDLAPDGFCKLLVPAFNRGTMASKRELIQPHEGAKWYASRGENSQFAQDQVSVGKSLAADRQPNRKPLPPRGRVIVDIRESPDDHKSIVTTQRELASDATPRDPVPSLVPGRVPPTNWPTSH